MAWVRMWLMEMRISPSAPAGVLVDAGGGPADGDARRLRQVQQGAQLGVFVHRPIPLQNCP